MSTDPAAATNSANGSDQPNWAGYSRTAATAAIVGIALYVIAGFANLSAAEPGAASEMAKTRFLSTYLTSFTFWLCLPVGAMALLCIGYLTKTSWALLLRRPLEAATRTLPLLALFWLPLAILVASGGPNPYWWTHPEDTPVPPTSANPGANVSPDDKRKLAEAYSEYMIARAVEHEREARREGTLNFLSPRSFIVVGITLFAIWGLMILILNRWGSRTDDDPAKVDANLTRLNKFAGPGLIIYALTITVAATQWVMSIEPSWASTMFPVIFAVNQFLVCFAFCLAFFLTLVSKPPFVGLMRPKFQLDMGTLLLAFTMFWAYTSFSQFMLIWIGNLPEEIPFYLRRSAGGWWYISAALIAFHFALPFMLLLFRDIKLHPARLRMVAIYLLVICAIDVVWWIEPTFLHTGSFPFWLMNIGAILGMGGVWGLYFVWQLKQYPILPMNETYLLPEGHHHEHH